MIKSKKWLLMSMVGILIFSSGLCIFGEALTLKNSNQSWFLLGSISLVLINSGLCSMITANFK